MFEGAFSLRGRIGRVRFLLNSLALAFGSAALALGLALLVLPARNTGVGAIAFGLCLLLTAPVFLWFTLSLHARRLRDIGLDPLFVIPGWILLEVVDKLVAAKIPVLSLGAHGGTVVGVVVNLGLTLALLFWPGRGDASETPPPAAPEPGREPRLPRAGPVGAWRWPRIAASPRVRAARPILAATALAPPHTSKDRLECRVHAGWLRYRSPRAATSRRGGRDMTVAEAADHPCNRAVMRVA